MKPQNYYPPVPFAIIQDTREQTPFRFPASVPVIVDDLYPGDYSIHGLENHFAVERKSLDDLINTLFGAKTLADGSKRYNRNRFEEELTAMAPYKRRYVAVTSPLSALEAHFYNSSVDPLTILRMISGISARTGVDFRFFASHEEASRIVAIDALEFWRNFNGLSKTRPKLRPERLTRKKVPMPKPPKKARGKATEPHAHPHAHACDPATTLER